MPVALPASMSAWAVGDLVERVGAVDRHRQPSGGDVVEERLQDVGGQVGGVAAVGGEPDAASGGSRSGRSRGTVHWLLSMPGEADDAVHARRAQRVGQRRRADELERDVDAVRDDLAHRVGDLAVVDERVVDADRPAARRRGRRGAWSRGRSGRGPWPGRRRPCRPRRCRRGSAASGRAGSRGRRSASRRRSAASRAPRRASPSRASDVNGMTWAAGTQVYSA